MSRGGRPDSAISTSPLLSDSTVASRFPIRKRRSSFGRVATKAAMSRGAKYFAVDTAPTESLPPSPVLSARIASAKSRIARSTPREASSAASPALVRRMPVAVRSNSFSATASSRPRTRAVRAAGVMLSAAAACTSEPASAIACRVSICRNERLRIADSAAFKQIEWVRKFKSVLFVFNHSYEFETKRDSATRPTGKMGGS